MLKGLFTKIIGDSNERELRGFQPMVDKINELEDEMKQLSDEDLSALTKRLKDTLLETTQDLRDQRDQLKRERGLAQERDEQDRLTAESARVDDDLRKEEGRILNELLPEAFAAARESSRRTTGLRHFDVQLLGGIVLHEGKVAEMKTGEGKTLVATLPVYLNALTGRGVHIVTVNDYLAKRDAQWMGPIYHLLGLMVGVIQHDSAFLFDPTYPSPDDRYQFLRPVERWQAYAADITYGTNNEFGFDYLRDNMVWDFKQCVQRELNYAIVDEVDNILIDEARTPLIISGAAEESSENYRRLAALAPRLRRDEDFTIDEKARIVVLTEPGTAHMEGWLGVDNLYSVENYALTPYLDNALRAQFIYQRDRDYIVKDGQVIIVDEFTGRLMHGRRYSEGLHQAIEAKEEVEVQRESLTLATITFQNYFRMYKKLAGMTGTAATEGEEFHKIYKLDVTTIPTHKLMIRKELPDAVYKSEESKFGEVVKEIKALHAQGRPVLVGTVSVEKSEVLSELLRRQGVPHQVLNAKLHEKEAQVIAQAGRPGAVTIATNMAGRGVDILLGGNPEGLARDELRRQGMDLTTVAPDVWKDTVAQLAAETEADKQKIIGLGGVHIIGTERHEARRIDNQLRGRSGRQGDPGSSRFYLSLEDDLMRRFGGSSIAGLMDRLGVEDDVPIEHGLVSKAIENAQIKVEGYNFDIRKHVLEYDDVVNKQREVIYAERRRILQETSLRAAVQGMMSKEIESLVNSLTSSPHREDWDLEGLWASLRVFLPVPFSQDQIETTWGRLKPQDIVDAMNILAESAYDQMQENFAQDIWHDIEHTGMSLAELARSQDGLFQVLSDMTHYYLDEETWLKLQNTPLNAIDHDLTDPIGDALGRAMSLYRDRHVMLKAVDTLWVRHLTELDRLREGIGLRAYGQQDPLISYKKEAYEMYEGLLAGIEHDIVYQLLHVGLKVQQPRRVQEVRTNRTDGGKPQRAAPASHGRPVGKVGRNDLCPCGSGKKFKHCHGSGLPASAGGARPGDGRQMLPQAQPSGKVPAGQAERKDAKNTGKKR